MTRKRGAEAKEDGDYDPYDSAEDDGQVKRSTSNQVVRSSRGRLVKAKQYSEDDESDEEEPGNDRHNADQSDSNFVRGHNDGHYQQSSMRSHRPKQAKRQRWVPHNPHLLGASLDDDEDSKDIQISDDDESGDEGASRSRRRVLDSNRMKGASVPVRDESGKFVGVRAQTAAERRQANVMGRSGGGGGIFKTAAVTVLREEKRLMSTGEIARIALKRGYVKVQGRTPEATMASAMYTDVKRKEDRSTFIRPHEGLFGLREWVEEGIDFKDPAQDKFPEESMQGALRRSRISGQQVPRAASRNSNAGSRVKTNTTSPGYEPLSSHSPSQNQTPSNQGDNLYVKDDYSVAHPDAVRSTEELPTGLPPRLGGGTSGLDSRHHPPAVNGRVAYTNQHSTPFGSNRGGPSVEIFKSRLADGNSHTGLNPTSKRSMSGSLLPGFPTPQRATSTGRNKRKSGPHMASADSGNMLLLLNAVDQSMDRSNSNKLGVLHKPLPGFERRQPSGALRREQGDERQVQLTVQGFNATRIVTAQAFGQATGSTMQSNQVNILNLPLPDAESTHGRLDAEEVVPEDADFDPSKSAQGSTLVAPQPYSNPPPGAEATLQALDHAFGRAPLSMMGSLSGALPLTFSIPTELPPLNLTEPQENGGPAAAEVVRPGAIRLPAAGAIRQLGMNPGSAFSAAGNSQQKAGGLANPMQDFGVPEEGVKHLPDVEAAVTGMESSLGGRHPKVGKGYLYLSRVYQCVATPEYYQKAQQALHRAYEICFACQKPQ